MNGTFTDDGRGSRRHRRPAGRRAVRRRRRLRRRSRSAARATVERDAGYSPAPDDLFTILRGADRDEPSSASSTRPGSCRPTRRPRSCSTAPGRCPTAAAGADVDVTESTPPGAIVLDGSGSTDVDGTIVSYAGRASDGVVLTGRGHGAGRRPRRPTTPSFLATLEVCDDHGLCDTDSAQRPVRNAAPVATAAGDRVGGGADRRSRSNVDVHRRRRPRHPHGHGRLGRRSDRQPVAGRRRHHHRHPHLRRAPASRTAEVCVTDDDGGRGCASTDGHRRRATTAPSPVDDAATTDRGHGRSTSTCSTTTPTRPRPTATSSVAAVRNGVPRRRPRSSARRPLHAGGRLGAAPTPSRTTSATASSPPRPSSRSTVTCVPDAPVADAGGDRSLAGGQQRRRSFGVAVRRRRRHAADRGVVAGRPGSTTPRVLAADGARGRRLGHRRTRSPSATRRSLRRRHRRR